MSRPLRSDVELPVPAQGSPLDFLFAQEEIECCGNRIGALSQLFRQIALADDYVAGRVLAAASLERPAAQRPEEGPRVPPIRDTSLWVLTESIPAGASNLLMGDESLD